jgi:ariadne-1
MSNYSDSDEEDDNYSYTYSDAEEDDEYYADQMSLEADDGNDNAESKENGTTDTHSTKRKSSALRLADSNPNAAPMSHFCGSSDGFENDTAAVRIMAAANIAPIMEKRVSDVTEVLGIPRSAALILLREHKWAKERLFEIFYNDPERVQASSGVKFRCSPVPVKKSSKRRHCEICYDDDGYTPQEMISMPCGHEFCKGCWRGFTENMISDGPTCIRTRCPQAGCSEIVTEEEVAKAAPELLPKFESYQLRSFVEIDGNSRWCPGPGCERVAVGKCSGLGGGLSGPGVFCHCDDCGSSFCLKCGEEPHAPLSCRDLRQWNEKCKNESETANWILANTKSCPKCSSRIEKNQGCNHMTCQQCKYEFCWICMGEWSTHGTNTGGYYRCNKYDPEDKNSNDQSDAAKAKKELDRYLHYYKRYHAHAEAQSFAKKQLIDTEERMVMLQEQSDNATWTEVEFLKAANEQLVECRRVLKFTYAFAYYMVDDKLSAMQRERYEHHQEVLERFTEVLSELSEMPLASMDRTSVVNQTRVVDRFMKNILTYVEDGMDE